MQERSPALRHYILLMRLLGCLYLLGALLFFFFPNELFYLVNVGPKVFKAAETIPDSSEYFWLVLASSMMAMLSALSFLSAESPEVRGYTLVHILSKVVSSVGFLYMFLNHHRYFGYLVGIAIDFPIAVLVSGTAVRITKDLRKRIQVQDKT